MHLIEEKSLNEVHELFYLSELKINYKYLTIAILEAEYRLIFIKTFKKVIEEINKLYIENPYKYTNKYRIGTK